MDHHIGIALFSERGRKEVRKIKCPVCEEEFKGEQGVISHMTKIHPEEFQRWKEQLINKKEEKMENPVLQELTREAKEKTDERPGLLSPPPSAEEIHARKMAELRRSILDQYRLMLMVAEDNTLQKMIDNMAEKVKLDPDVHQALSLEMFLLTVQPIIGTQGLFNAGNEAVYKEFEKEGVKIDRPITPTLDALLKTLRSRVDIGTLEKRKKIKGEE